MYWYECETCPRTFSTQGACNQHMNGLDHWAPTFDCETCTKEFNTQRAAEQHMTALGHWAPELPCQTCEKRFRSEIAANQHMEALGHYKFYCKHCKKQFENANNLKMHLNSKVHRGTNVGCPFCKEGFTTASGLTHHLEMGSCPRAPALDRDSILRMIRMRDPHGHITKKQIEWHQHENVTFSATGQAFNGCSWECYLCHRKFGTVGALNAHLNSPAHKQKVYHCPNSTMKCKKDFVTLAALFNHLESETCAFMRFDKVQQRVGDVLQGRKLIKFS